ncbi:MAG TPA: ABC transporter permease subunit [Candidatus Gemmiger stercoravium]|nr:ABC transporter permease subunit [Candidatus Gemmiger stercoravium]
MPTAAKTKKRPRKSGEGGLVANFRYDLKNNKGLLGLTLPAVAWFLVFAYAPMLGLVIAFQKYSPAKGIFGSEFVFLDNFRFFFGSQDFVRVTVNTLLLNTLFILATNFVAILMAIALSEIKNKYFKKVSQSVIILPHFISWTVVALLIEAFLKTEGGFVNNILAAFGAEPIKFMQTPELWPAILTILRVWQGAGYSSIVYLAAITGFDQSMYEAARVDGATRLQCITRITLPLLRPTIVLLLLMAVGKIFNGDFGMVYAIVGNNTLLYPTTDIIDTYVYRQLMEQSNMGMSSAVGLWQSIMGFIMVVIMNKVTKKIDSDSALF